DAHPLALLAARPICSTWRREAGSNIPAPKCRPTGILVAGILRRCGCDRRNHYPATTTTPSQAGEWARRAPAASGADQPRSEVGLDLVEGDALLAHRVPLANGDRL